MGRRRRKQNAITVVAGRNELFWRPRGDPALAPVLPDDRQMVRGYTVAALPIDRPSAHSSHLPALGIRLAASRRRCLRLAASVAVEKPTSSDGSADHRKPCTRTLKTWNDVNIVRSDNIIQRKPMRHADCHHLSLARADQAALHQGPSVEIACPLCLPAS